MDLNVRKKKWEERSNYMMFNFLYIFELRWKNIYGIFWNDMIFEIVVGNGGTTSTYSWTQTLRFLIWNWEMDDLRNGWYEK